MLKLRPCSQSVVFNFLPIRYSETPLLMTTVREEAFISGVDFYSKGTLQYDLYRDSVHKLVGVLGLQDRTTVEPPNADSFGTLKKCPD